MLSSCSGDVLGSEALSCLCSLQDSQSRHGKGMCNREPGIRNS